jgi:glycosyltransferase involved in cell wall biosynthesis
MKKKKIVCTVINDLNYDQRMIRICSSLVEAGFDVTLVGRVKRKTVPLVEREFKQKRLRCFFYSGKLFYVEYNIRLFFYLLFNSFDIVNSIDLDTILAGYFSSTIKRKKIVFDAHEYFTEMPEIITRPNVQKMWKRVERFAIPKMKHCYTVCESLAELFEKEYNVKFNIVRNVPFKNHEDFSTIKKDKKIILYQGSLNDGRGLEEMIEAMQGIDNAEFWMAGEGEKSDKLRQKVKENKLENKIKFLGYLQPEELATLTPKVYIGLNLLQNKGLNYYYSLANKSFDYIQALVPSINMDFPEYQNIKKEYEVALLIPDLKMETIQKAVIKLLENKELYNKLKENCKLAREEYIWEKEVEKLLISYQ